MEKIKISEDLCTYIESLHYETNALQDLLMRMNNASVDKVNDFWLDKYMETYKEYNLAKQQLEQEYIVPIYGDKQMNWYLEFDTAEIGFKVEED